ncbi:MAG TPA: hypothetical protein PK358_08260 [Spirochaetota bacterium]|nr:hypothetical protein [Spirochaetota bacterium]
MPEMISFLKAFSSLAILFISLTVSVDIFKILVLLIFFLSIALSVRVTVMEIFKKNTIVLSFAVFYLVFGAISALISDKGYELMFIICLKIILIYNVIWFSFKWLGTRGLMGIIAFIPWERLKLYLLLVVKGIYIFRRNSEMIVMQIKSRLGSTVKNRRILARYYTRNIIFRELYSMQYIQATLYTRLPDRINFFLPEQKAGPAEILIPLSLLFFIINLFFPVIN